MYVRHTGEYEISPVFSICAVQPVHWRMLDYFWSFECEDGCFFSREVKLNLSSQTRMSAPAIGPAPMTTI